ncbi:MAG: gamma carbonic anhydrase family protein [Halobacteriovorax sp.]|mgnify:FL=1|nr:gamma carbonic anhydrase family protein [Halobacteriovorax sp.]|tara:strand:+ start:1043 stop:1573 length:531 start_codon:yes stop_codon:yes gene_type:complete
MPLYSYKDTSPELGEGVYIAPSADVIGRVFLEENVNLWHQVVARGDVNDIRIGAGTNIQDLSMLHVVEEIPLIIGKGVSVGHGAIIHACTIGDHCLIGMGSIILDGAVIGEHSVVAAGSVVAPGKQYPPNSMIMGSPAKVVRQLTDKEYEGYGNHYKSYVKYKDEFLDESIVKLID